MTFDECIKIHHPKDASSPLGAHEKSRSHSHFSLSPLPWKYYIAVETTKIRAHDQGQLPLYQSQTHDSTPLPQIYSSHASVSPHEVSTSDTSESIPDHISCHIRHVEFFSQSCAIHSTFIPAFGRKTFHPRPQDGVFKF